MFEELKISHGEILNSLLLGFDLACSCGPLCREPLMGTIFILEEIKPRCRQQIESINNVSSEDVGKNEEQKS